jgi:hypothetical protein
MDDLSHLLPAAAPLGATSMQATNTVSEQAGSMTSPGSPSEATVDVPARPPLFDLPPATPPSVLVSGGESPVSSPWTAAGGGPWREAADDTGYLPPRDDGGRWAEK